MVARAKRRGRKVLEATREDRARSRRRSRSASAWRAAMVARAMSRKAVDVGWVEPDVLADLHKWNSPFACGAQEPGGIDLQHFGCPSCIQ